LRAELGRSHCSANFVSYKPAGLSNVPIHGLRRGEAQAAAVAADLEELRRLRHHLIFNTKARVPATELLAAIDDYVEKLTGDRTALHASRHSIG
jgi:hypothetical protein